MQLRCEQWHFTHLNWLGTEFGARLFHIVELTLYEIGIVPTVETAHFSHDENNYLSHITNDCLKFPFFDLLYDNIILFHRFQRNDKTLRLFCFISSINKSTEIDKLAERLHSRFIDFSRNIYDYTWKKKTKPKHKSDEQLIKENAKVQNTNHCRMNNISLQNDTNSPI